EAVALDWLHADLAYGRPSRALVLLLHVLRLRAHGDDDVALRVEDAVHELVVDGRGLPPGAEAVVAAAAGGDLVDEFEDAVLARPRVGQAVDDQDVVPGVGRGLDALEVPLGREAGELQRVELEPVRVRAGAAALRVDHGDSLAK